MRLSGTAWTLLLGLLLVVPSLPTATAGPQPGLFCDEGEAVHGRVFPNPENVTDFVGFDEARCGLETLEERHGDLIEVRTVGESVGWDNYETGEHDRFPVLAVEVTDETVPIEDKRGNLVFINSIHGNEKGAREGALRVIEDLLTGQGMATRVEAATGQPLDTVLDEVRLVFTFPNPDGWAHEYAEYRPNDACFVSATCTAADVTGPGEPGAETQNFVRVNGNGTDLNRQYPTTGTPHPSWPALTEPEVDAQVAYFEKLEGDVIAGVDLHGMLNAENLTYLMIKDTQRTLSEVPQHEALARTTAEYIAGDERLDPWREAVGPTTVWGSTYDLLGYSAPGTGGAYVVQDTGLNAPGFTVELAYNHIAFDNYYQGPGQAMNEMHVAVMRDIALGFLDYAYHEPGNATATGDGSIGVVPHPTTIPDGRFNGEDADPTDAFRDLASYGANVQVLDASEGLAPSDLEGLEYLVIPDAATDEIEVPRPDCEPEAGACAQVVAPPAGAIRAWVEAGGTLVLTDRAIQWAVEMGLADEVRTVEDVTGKVDRIDRDHPLAEGTNPPVESIVDGNPLRYDAGTVPNHCLAGFSGTSVGERVLATGGPTGSEETCTVLGEASIGDGAVRVLGVALPPPVDEGPHGVDSYALTPNGYRILANTLGVTVENASAGQPAQTDAGDANDAPGLAPIGALAAIAGAAVALRRRE